MNESKLSAIIGGAIIIIIGIMVVNYFRNLRPGTTTPTGTNIEETSQSNQKTYTVEKGDTLWSIAEKEYNDGYRWTEIKDANKLTNADQLNAGQTLIIPNVSATEAATLQATSTPIALVSPTPARTILPTVTASPSAIAQATVAPQATPATTATPSTSISTPSKNVETITGDTYTVVHGDTLWDIAVKAYGDGYQWTKISKANKLANPNLIHAGNVFSIPR